MLALSISFSHATAGRMIQFLCLLKVLCLSFARLRPSYALDHYLSDHKVIMKVASITLMNRSIKYKHCFSTAIKTGTEKTSDLHGSLT